MAYNKGLDVDPDRLHSALSNLVKMYQFRSRNEHLSYGVTVAEAYCLRALWKRGRLPMGSLAEDQSVRRSTMTGVIDQLVEKGMVRRIGDPNDRRRQLVELTEQGSASYEATNRRFQAMLEKAMQGRTQRERESIIDFLEQVRSVIAEWRESDG